MKRLERLRLEPGVRYPGYGWINEFGEMQFTPQQVGANKGKKRLLCEGTGYTVYLTDKLVILHVSVNREQGEHTSPLKTMAGLCRIFNNILEQIRNYEI